MNYQVTTGRCPAGEKTSGRHGAWAVKAVLVGLILLIWLFPGSALAANAPEEEALERTAREIYDQIMCPLCPGQTIAQSNSETSRQMRDLVLRKLHQGETKEEVLQYFTSRYGERIMAKPDKKGLNLLLWFLPLVLCGFAAVVIYVLVQRWSRLRRPDEEIDPQAAQLSEYEARLEKELAEFDKES